VSRKIIFGTLFVCVAALLPQSVFAARLFVGPTTGTFTVGSTFEVSLFLDTRGQSINAFSAELQFPPDKLQLVSPTAGKSIIGVWTAPPQFNNQAGTIDLAGGIPNGITTNQGLISTLTFRVKQVGTATLHFGDISRVLLNDGKGTDVLQGTQSGIYRLTLPPPAGPLVASETHPRQDQWYPASQAILRWANNNPVSGYSYVLSKSPVEAPDGISEGVSDSVAYKILADGTHYFHIKALRSGVWGGITHFAVNVDTEAPAEFPILVAPSSRTTSYTPVVQFQTTDVHSGIEHYEFKVVPLSPRSNSADASRIGSEQFFIEAEGKQILNLTLGSYDIIARAYDHAGNFREETERLTIATPLGLFVSNEGIHLGPATILWHWLFVAMAMLAGVLLVGAQRVRRWYETLVEHHARKELPHDVNQKLEELRAYRQKYGKLVVLLLLIGLSLFNSPRAISAATTAEFSPPVIQTASRSIANDEIFYVGGVTDVPKAEIVVYLQNLETGETLSETVVAGTNREWFYRYNSFLTTGNYLMWAQARVGEEVSPPSPQVRVQVRKTALEFGGSRFSYQFLYLGVSLLFLLIIIGLTTFIVVYTRRGRRRHHEFMREIREAEESVRRGFAVLRRDVEAELSLVHKMKASKELSDEEKQREGELLRDLSQIEKHIGKEIWDVERVQTS